MIKMHYKAWILGAAMIAGLAALDHFWPQVGHGMAWVLAGTGIHYIAGRVFPDKPKPRKERP